MIATRIPRVIQVKDDPVWVLRRGTWNSCQSWIEYSYLEFRLKFLNIKGWKSHLASRRLHLTKFGEIDLIKLSFFHLKSGNLENFESSSLNFKNFNRLNASLKFDRSVLDFTIWVFYKHKTLAIRPILTSDALLCENKIFK